MMRIDRQQMARRRSQFYTALAQGFCKPERAVGEEGGLEDLLRNAAQCLDQTWTVSLDGDGAPGDEDALLALEIEYNRLFVGPGRPAALPYESVYRKTGGTGVGAMAREVLRCYAEAGLGMSPDRRDWPDHVATELGFMAYLVERGTEAENGDAERWAARERAFLRDHLLAWLPQFCRRVREVSRHPFYAALAELTAAFIRSEARRVGLVGTMGPCW